MLHSWLSAPSMASLLGVYMSDKYNCKYRKYQLLLLLLNAQNTRRNRSQHGDTPLVTLKRCNYLTQFIEQHTCKKNLVSLDKSIKSYITSLKLIV